MLYPAALTTSCSPCCHCEALAATCSPHRHHIDSGFWTQTYFHQPGWKSTPVWRASLALASRTTRTSGRFIITVTTWLSPSTPRLHCHHVAITANMQPPIPPRSHVCEHLSVAARSLLWPLPLDLPWLLFKSPRYRLKTSGGCGSLERVHSSRINHPFYWQSPLILHYVTLWIVNHPLVSRSCLACYWIKHFRHIGFNYN
jgi:hypothetical protein